MLAAPVPDVTCAALIVGTFRGAISRTDSGRHPLTEGAFNEGPTADRIDP